MHEDLLELWCVTGLDRHGWNGEKYSSKSEACGSPFLPALMVSEPGAEGSLLGMRTMCGVCLHFVGFLSYHN